MYIAGGNMGAGHTPLRQPSVEEADSRNQVFEVLKNARRRAVLRYLLYEDPEAEFRELVEYVAAKENGADPDAIGADERNRVRTALYQHHLDKLAETGFIEYQKREGIVRRNGRTDEVVEFIEPSAQGRPTNAIYALGATVLGLGILILTIPAVTAVAGIAISILGIGVVLYGSVSTR